jgi:hypothetical protein
LIARQLYYCKNNSFLAISEKEKNYKNARKPMVALFPEETICVFVEKILEFSLFKVDDSYDNDNRLQQHKRKRENS